MKNTLRILPAAMALTFALAACGKAEAPVAAAPEAAAPEAAAPAPVFSAEVQDMINEYELVASELSQVIGGAAAHDESREKLDRLMKLSEGITPAFIARHPACKNYLQASLRILTQWPNLDPATIERDYHQDAALPKDGTPAACYHMKDLIVHPATAAALLSGEKPDRVQAKKEIDEVLAHVGVVRAG